MVMVRLRGLAPLEIWNDVCLDVDVDVDVYDDGAMVRMTMMGAGGDDGGTTCPWRSPTTNRRYFRQGDQSFSLLSSRPFRLLVVCCVY